MHGYQVGGLLTVVRCLQSVLKTLECSLAYLEMRIVLARMIYTFDWEWVNKDLDWESESRVYWMWQKPDLMMQYRVVH
jgi:hypothetical protein